MNLIPNKEGIVRFKTGNVHEYRIQYIEYFIVIVDDFPCDLFFFIWRVLWNDEKRSFEFPIKAYFDSNFWNQTQKNLAILGFLEPVEYEQSKHISHEKPLPERSKVLDLGKDAFQEWDKKGIINEIDPYLFIMSPEYRAYSFINAWKKATPEDRANNMKFLKLMKH